MRIANRYFTLIALPVVLGACSLMTGILDSEREAETPPPTAARTPGMATPAGGWLPPTSGATPPPPSLGPAPRAATGFSEVARLQSQTEALRRTVDGESKNLRTVRTRVLKESALYQGAVASIQRNLAAGAPAADPELVGRWNEAQTNLDALSADLDVLRAIAAMGAKSSDTAAELGQRVDAALGQPSTKREDRDSLRALQVDVDALAPAITRMTADARRVAEQNAGFLERERERLVTLSLSIKKGGAAAATGPEPLPKATPAERPVPPARTVVPSPPIASPLPPAPPPAPPTPAAAAMATAPPDGERPFVVIRFDRAAIAYEEPLFQAVSEALRRRPETVFRLVAMSPSASGNGAKSLGSGGARQRMRQVMRSLIAMGLPADRIDLAARVSAAVAFDEVHIFLR